MSWVWYSHKNNKKLTNKKDRNISRVMSLISNVNSLLLKNILLRILYSKERMCVCVCVCMCVCVMCTQVCVCCAFERKSQLLLKKDKYKFYFIQN